MNYIKVNRTDGFIRKYGWILTVIIAVGGIWYHKLGLIVIPMMIMLMGMSLLRGRFWCGNFCPHGSLFDFVLLPLSRNKKIPGVFRSGYFAFGFLLLFSYRIGTRIAYSVKFFGQMGFWDKIGFIFVSSYLMVMTAGGILSILYTPRTWCNFCPMGTMQKIMYRMGKKIRLTKLTDKKVVKKDLCVSCKKCEKVCPMQLKPYEHLEDNHFFDSDDCIKCSVCIDNCPIGILEMNNPEKAA